MRENIIEYLVSLGIENPNDFIVDEVIDRALNYMRRKDISTELERVIARAIYNSQRKFEKELDGAEFKISSLTDGGQSVSYSDKVVSYMNSIDEEVLEGIIPQLRQFRKVGVIYEDTE